MGVDKANPKPEFPVPPEPTTGSLIVPRPSPEGAISKALCPDCAFPCGQAPGRGLRTLAQPTLRLGGRLPERICPVGPLANRHDGCGFGVRPGQQALPLASERTDTVRSTPSGSVRRAPTYAHRRAAVYGVPSSEGHQRILHMPPSALTACHLMPASLLRSSKGCPLPCMPSFLRPPCPIGVDITEKIDRLPGVLAGVNTHPASP